MTDVSVPGLYCGNAMNDSDEDISAIKCPECGKNNLSLCEWSQGYNPHDDKYYNRGTFLCLNINCNQQIFNIPIKTETTTKLIKKTIVVFTKNGK